MGTLVQDDTADRRDQPEAPQTVATRASQVHITQDLLDWHRVRASMMLTAINIPTPASTSPMPKQ